MAVLLQYFSGPKEWTGVALFVMAVMNVRHALTQQDEAFDLPEETATDRLCRQIRFVEMRIWVLGWYLFGAIALLIFFV